MNLNCAVLIIIIIIIIFATVMKMMTFNMIIIIIIIIERKDLGGVMSKDCKDTLQMLKTVTKRECDAK